jgi:transglutaminase-like putative cysteine protease
MLIKVGYELLYECPQPMPILSMLYLHPSRMSDLLRGSTTINTSGLACDLYEDSFGNTCGRMTLPPGRTALSWSGVVADSGEPDPVVPNARQHPIEELPPETLMYLMASRFCDIEWLKDFAWAQFGAIEPGWARVQAICDFVHNHIRFDYMTARCTRTAFEAFNERTGVCRDFAHLAIALCRCVNVPARYCTGYLGDIGVPKDPAPMDFSAWFEVYLAGRWYTFDARHNTPRIGRVLMARGRDATDVAITTTFGPNLLASFKVVTDEVVMA